MSRAAATGRSERPALRSTPRATSSRASRIGTYNVVANDPQRLGLDRTIADAIAKTPLPNNFTGGDGLNTAYYTWAAPAFEGSRTT